MLSVCVYVEARMGYAYAMCKKKGREVVVRGSAFDEVKKNKG